MAYRGCDLILSCHEAETDHQKWIETRNLNKINRAAVLSTGGFYRPGRSTGPVTRAGGLLGNQK